MEGGAVKLMVELHTQCRQAYIKIKVYIGEREATVFLKIH